MLFTPHAQAVVGMIGVGVFERRLQKFFAAPHSALSSWVAGGENGFGAVARLVFLSRALAEKGLSGKDRMRGVWLQ